MDPEKKQFAWWYYFWLLVVLIVTSPIFFEAIEDWLHWALAVPSLVGLWGYLRRRPLGRRYLWIGYFCLLIIDLLARWLFGPSVEIPPEFRLAFSVVIVVCSALVIPLYIALWRYAFRSPDVWRGTTRAA